ncbi:MAG: class C sortase [Lachnospira sp.]|nr:class C sortase [Lachnospira sp.]
MKKKRYALLFFGFLTGFFILMYPSFADAWNRHRNKLLAAEYEETVSEIQSDEIERIAGEAREYNRQHTVNEVQDIFENSEDYTLSHPYDSLLNPNGDEVMGSIEIPKINIELAIYHGTGAEALSKGVGHIQGTSIPVGGVNTHAVLAAHRGLANAKLFTDLDRMETGDIFFLHILGDTLAYQVDQINVVSPDDLTLIQIEPGRDLCTLLTCTPYGVNTHRLLVRGSRVPYRPEAVSEESGKYEVTLQQDDPVRFAAAGLTAALIIVVVMRMMTIRKKRHNHNKGRSLDEEDK